ncbi:MAG: ABC transporter ATP-binding protein [Eubacterium sp.]|nr:ABC transporter ATP-binding protein [Eubacterium sp.]
MIDNVIEIKNVIQRYKGSSEESLRNISLSVKKGETILLCGASGSGKTSLIRLINGLIPHYYQGELSGDIRVLTRDVSKIELYELAGIVGTVFQNPRSQFFSVDTDGEIVFGPENIGLDPKKIKERKDNIVSEMDLNSLMGRSLFELSGGEKQRIACASVAALIPDIILLDEPSSNLDLRAMENLHEIVSMWKEQGKTIIISEHRLWYIADLLDRIIYMEDGKIARQWNGNDFQLLSKEELKKLKLRPTKVDRRCVEILNEKKDRNYSPELSDERVIQLKDFYFSYDQKPYILKKKKYIQADGDKLSLSIPKLDIPKESVIAITGRNGTGKSTFLRCVCGLEKDCTGKILVDGVEYKKRSRIGLSYLVMQDVNHQLFTDSVEAEVYLSMKEKDEKRCHEILDSLGLLKYKDTHPMALSGGQKQRVAIASAIAAGAKLLLFDEPTSGLDYTHMEKVGKLLKKLADSGSTVLVSTHDPEFINECCDYELRIQKGKVVYFTRIL